MDVKTAINNLDAVLSILAFDSEDGEWDTVAPGQHCGHFDEMRRFVQHDATYFKNAYKNKRVQAEARAFAIQ